MRIVRVVVRVVAVAVVAAASLAPNGARAETGDAAAKKPLAVTLDGPATVPVAVTVKPATTKAGAKAPMTLWVDIYLDGAKLKRVNGPPGAEASLSLTVPAGTHLYEFRADDPASASASIRWTAPAKAPVEAVAPVAPVPTPAPVAAMASTGKVPMTLDVGVLVYTRMSNPIYGAVAPGISLALFRPLGGPLSAGVGASWRHMSAKRTFADYNGRVLAPYVLDVDAVPLEALGRYSIPAGTWTLDAQGGIGAEFARSNFQKANLAPRARRIENDWAFTASIGGGATRNMGAGTVTVSVAARAARHSFDAHGYDLLHGVETGVSYCHPF
jgi:hypothetical protein